MLLTSRTYQQLQSSQQRSEPGSFEPSPAIGWSVAPDTVKHREKMLLVHQIGSVRVGEIVRYTLTYTPSLDRVLPSPSYLHVKIKNTSAIPLRAAYLHGPYTLYTACYPATFDPNYKPETTYKDGAPEFEPNLKAGGSWTSRLAVPENIRETAGKSNVKRATDGSAPSFTWIIEISSQIIFSTSAVVHFELLVGRDEKSTELGFSSLTGQAAVAAPGQLHDHQQGKRSKTGHGAAQSRGVFNHAVKLVVDDTESLWNKPSLPEWDDDGIYRGERRSYPAHGEEDDVSAGKGSRADTSSRNSVEQPMERKRKRVHLVVLTHGLHSNLGSDMLYLKESIDAAAKEARESVRKRRCEERSKGRPKSADTSGETKEPDSSTAPLSGGQDELDPGAEVDEDEEEEVIVRGFAGNTTRTERGIQYLGKRLAKWILSMTYPDQPYLPAKKSLSKKLSQVFSGDKQSDAKDGPPQHNHSSIHRPGRKPNDLAYKITSISFVAHSLGGLVQTYAIAYIHKHSPNFFNEIRPINFVGMAVPFLGLSNENPLYVKFALDFGLVGRTGQDLGLTWRAPTMVRSGWGAMIGGIGSEGQRAHRQPDPGSKPLLRILPSGHTHHVLKLFRNRTIYSNVVNDGIVPLRTSCLLFLDWSGLGRVEKARRENGLVGTMAEWGWAELTGANKSSSRHLIVEQNSDACSHSSVSGDEGGNAKLENSEVPQPEEDAVKDDTTAQGQETHNTKRLPDSQRRSSQDKESDASRPKEPSSQQPSNPLSGFLSFGLGLLRPAQPDSHHNDHKNTKIYKSSQTTRGDAEDAASPSSGYSSPVASPTPTGRPGAVRGDSILEDSNNVYAPPKTTIFEAAGDVLNPPLPSKEFLTNPQGRLRTIFHDRVYHPDDIPPPLTKKKPRLRRKFSSDSRRSPARSDTASESQPEETSDTSSMKVEEKIARAYHRGLSWRKVLVRLEPDAHNNMVVRRMFSNAYGWPVIKHLVDTHFADTYAANTADVNESNEERAKPMTENVGKHGEEVITEGHTEKIKRSDSEIHEANDRISELTEVGDQNMNSSSKRPTMSRKESAQWDDSLFDITDDEDDMGDHSNLRHRGHLSIPDTGRMREEDEKEKGTSAAEIADFLTRSPPPIEGKQKVSAPAGGTTSIGLGKSAAERVSNGKQRGRKTQGESKREEKEVSELVDDVTIVRISDDGL
ncbi:hypothetical protein N7G274_008527 [Stereocaulon virgatum]|uniref:DUF676 domain-containing protein n=1 Tax=Stereocaulon virgatum TaxID=373712 RepID=A0ABR3ZZV8_9LECA